MNKTINDINTNHKAAQQHNNDSNEYVRPEYLEKQKQEYMANLDREKETVWGYPIEEVTVNIPVYNNNLNCFDGDKTIHAVKLGRLYFYVKDELTPNYSYSAKEIKGFLLDGDIGAWIDELIVKEGYYMDFAGGVDNPRNYREKVFASIGATPWQAPCHDWQIWS